MIQILLIVVLADFLFYSHPIGWCAAAFAALLAIVVVQRRPRTLRRRSVRWMSAATCGLIAALLIEPDTLAITMTTLALASLAATARIGWCGDAGVWLRRWIRFVLLAPFVAIIDARRRQRVRRSRSSGRSVTGWLVPMALTCIFVVLFSIANPVFEDFITSRWQQVWRALVELASGAALDRLLFWILSAVGVLGLLRHRFRDRPARTAAAARPEPRWLMNRFVIRCLVLFNAVFLIENVLDVRYLWGGMALPAGISYASYAHRGAYPLVATALLAAAMVLFAFRPHGLADRSRLARWLVHIWLGQNLLLTLSALWRLDLYIGIYSMTRWRLAAGIWMLLVLFGLATILWRLISQRDNRWLLGVNTIATIAVLYVLIFPDLDAHIAQSNVEHCREAGGAGVELDLDYLIALGPSSLPALKWLDQNLELTALRPEIIAAHHMLLADLNTALADWRGWTLQRAGLVRR